MKIYDWFTFHNELDLLEIRLRILNPYVDYFVLVEATKTHPGIDKLLFFEENKERFKEWSNKIIHVIVDDLPPPRKIYFKKAWKLSSVLGLGRWRPEIYQRNQIKKGLKNCNKEDIIIVSDLDEIPNHAKFKELKENSNEGKVTVFSQKLYYYFLNGFSKPGWGGSKACNFKMFIKSFNGKADRLRKLRSFKLRFDMYFNKTKQSSKTIPNGGWHFSYLGNVNFIIEKLSNFCHLENYKLIDWENPEKIKEQIEKGRFVFWDMPINYVPIDNSFPEEIIKNKEKYSKFIKEEDEEKNV